MNKETRKCQNCHNEFKIEPEDFVFYAKINVSPPTFCSNCRLQRRLAWRNERILYKRKCDLCKRNIISIYHANSPYTVYCQKCIWSDRWNFLDFGRDYNWSKPFFQQFNELMLAIPQPAVVNVNAINSDYCNITIDSKNCYLLFSARENENCFYSHRLSKTKDCTDASFVNNSELCYQCVNCYNCYKTCFSQDVYDCLDCVFLNDCRNCQNCFGCVGLRNKSYHIFNKPYSKKEYHKQLNDFNLGSYKQSFNILKQFADLRLSNIHNYAIIYHSSDVTGEHIKNSKSCKFCFDVNGLEYSKYSQLFISGGSINYDVTNATKTELSYEGQAIGIGYNNLFNIYLDGDNNLSYCNSIFASSNLFGCVIMRSKQYCILNKQYTKEQYEALVPKIIEHMNSMPHIDKKGRVYKYGEFFPIELSPFSYNETVAQEYFPLTKEQAINKGYSWKEPEERNYQIQIPNDKLPDHIKDVNDSIIGQVIECGHKGQCNEQCAKAFKIIPPELEFYRKMNLPLPRLCPNCRHYQRIKQRNPLKLWHRKCQCGGAISDNGIYKNTIEHSHHKQDHCSNEFETSYAPERQEIIYCEQCYLQEVV